MCWTSQTRHHRCQCCSFSSSPPIPREGTLQENCKRLPSHTGQGQACTRITRLVGCSFVCLSPCRKWPNTQKNGCWLPPSDHIQSKTLFQTRQDQEKGMNGPASLLHSWRWVLLFFCLVILTSDWSRRTVLEACCAPPLESESSPPGPEIILCLIQKGKLNILRKRFSVAIVIYLPALS